jgi:hypothetical protein
MMMINPFGAKPVQKEFIQVKAKKGEPGAMPITIGRTSSWVKTIPNPNYKPTTPPPAEAAAPAPAPAPEPYTPKPLVPESTPQSSLTIAKPPEAPPPPQFSPGGLGATVDGNASGFKRKKSSARMSGLTTKGTGRFKIGGGQSSSSSGLNIGV